MTDPEKKEDPAQIVKCEDCGGEYERAFMPLGNSCIDCCFDDGSYYCNFEPEEEVYD